MPKGINLNNSLKLKLMLSKLLLFDKFLNILILGLYLFACSH